MQVRSLWLMTWIREPRVSLHLPSKVSGKGLTGLCWTSQGKSEQGTLNWNPSKGRAIRLGISNAIIFNYYLNLMILQVRRWKQG
jgi:hypothetical protein